MRSAILVDAMLKFEVSGYHIHITDNGGSVHLALTRHAFLANVARAKAVADRMLQEDGHKVVELGTYKPPLFREETERYEQDAPPA